jgi:hypothetical protein
VSVPRHERQRIERDRMPLDRPAGVTTLREKNPGQTIPSVGLFFRERRTFV